MFKLSRVFSILLPVLVTVFALMACGAQPPTTTVDLPGIGKGVFPKDVKAKRIRGKATDPTGRVIADIDIEDLDASASSVIDAQARAMEKQAEALNAALTALAAQLSGGGGGPRALTPTGVIIPPRRIATAREAESSPLGEDHDGDNELDPMVINPPKPAQRPAGPPPLAGDH